METPQKPSVFSPDEIFASDRDWLWGWRSPGWHVTAPTGIASWICALAHTLILDEDGLYDPAHFNDRLLLGLKGTMSEAELHVLRARLVGGVISKAQRAELKLPLPVGLVYDADNRVMLDPDQQVQQSVRLFFETFARTGSAWATVQAFRREGWKFPKRGQAGSGEVVWLELTHTIALDTLHNPRYAGAFCFGRTRT
jgi:hypothetical protein